MRVYLKIAWIVLTLALPGCNGLNVEKTPLAQPGGSPENAQPAPFTLREIRYAVPTGTPTVSQSPKGMLGLLACDPPYGLLMEGGISTRTVPSDDYKRIFRDTMEAQGYDMAGDPSRMFDEEEDEMRAAFVIGGRITDIKIDLCRKSRWGIYRGDTGEAAVTVEWTVFDLLHRRNIYKTTTKGYAKRVLPNYEGIALLMEQSFAAAANNLGADPQFHSLMFYGDKPEKPDDTVEDLNEDLVTRFDPQEKVTLDKMPVSSQSAQGRFEEIEKTAVMIEAAGGHGSGFFISKQGHILTNAHVVGHALRVRVVSSGKKEKMVGEVLRVNRLRDVALVKLEEVPPDLNIQTLPVRTEKLSVGEDVYAIGAPRMKRLQDTVTKGIVSAYRFDRKEKQPYIQADVDIYGGNSGGPLLDGRGNIIGISVLGWKVAEDTLGGLNWFIPIGDVLEKLGISY